MNYAKEMILSHVMHAAVPDLLKPDLGFVNNVVSISPEEKKQPESIFSKLFETISKMAKYKDTEIYLHEIALSACKYYSMANNGQNTSISQFVKNEFESKLNNRPDKNELLSDITQQVEKYVSIISEAAK